VVFPRAQFESQFSSVFLLMIWAQELGHTKFGEDKNLRSATDSPESKENLQRALGRLEYWVITNHVKFNKNKWWILHIGQCNPGCLDVCIDWEKRDWSVAMQKGILGVMADGKVDINHQCTLAVKRAFGILECIKHSIVNRLKEVIVCRRPLRTGFVSTLPLSSLPGL